MSSLTDMSAIQDPTIIIIIVYIEGSVTQRRNSILAILRKIGLCVTEHLGLYEVKSMFH